MGAMVHRRVDLRQLVARASSFPAKLATYTLDPMLRRLLFAAATLALSTSACVADLNGAGSDAGSSAASGKRYVFLTPVTFVPGAPYVRGGTSFQSVADADKACKDIADDDAAHPSAHGKSWAAWITDSTESTGVLGRVSARLVSDTSEIFLLDGTTKVAHAVGKDFASDVHIAPIGGGRAWTGENASPYDTIPSGPGAVNSCSDWASSSAKVSAVYGDATAVNFQWHSQDFQACDKGAALYCLQVDK